MNRIKELSVSSLDHLPSLQLLDLDHQLTPLVIRDQAFNKQTNLTRLVLGSNRKLQLEPRAFEGLVLDLSHNHIGVLGFKSFSGLPQLQTLLLTDNAIAHLGIPASLPKKLDLSSNALTHIRNDTIPADLQTLDLSDNFIAEPQSHIFSSLQSLDLSLNRFHCGPGLRDLVSWMRQTNVTLKGPVEKLRCEFPSALRGVPLVTVYGADDAQ
uniref:Uncharacterized protein n=1 Tax=Knipowitschia caucasica TaxID=637954 RepID=A0AAV2K821_KNICA